MTSKQFKATAVSPANIAFIKYWGKKDEKLNIPYNNSLSMNLSGCLTTTTVEFGNFPKDRVRINNQWVSGIKRKRVVKILNLVRKKAGVFQKAISISENNFPTGAGLASSASGFSALALAASRAAGLRLSQKELSILARRGSGSACRSIINGLAEWQAGTKNSDSFAVQLATPDFWELRDIIVLVNQEEKEVSSNEGHRLAETSSYFQTRLKQLPERIKKFKQAFFKKDFINLGKIIEKEAIDLHIIAMTSKPPIFYWSEETMMIIRAVRRWRTGGLPVFFTIDAGPNVHLICLERDIKKILRRLAGFKTIVNQPCRGSYLK